MIAYHVPGAVSGAGHVWTYIIPIPSHTYSLEVDAVIVSLLHPSKWREVKEPAQCCRR